MKRNPRAMTLGYRTIAVYLVLLLLSACEVTYKRGAVPTSMAADEQQCKSKHSEYAAYRECMVALGWFVSSADPTPQLAALTKKGRKDLSVEALKEELKTTQPIKRRAKEPSPPITPTELAASTKVNAPHSFQAQSKVEAGKDAAKQSAAQDISQPSLVVQPSKSIAEPDNAISGQRPKASARNPKRSKADQADVTLEKIDEEIVRVNSWWKLGGSTHNLTTDRQKCSDAIGPQDISTSETEVSTTMYRCMRKLGWYGL
ncbi:MAG: hypothetical protein AAF387_04320 [Pseudomonadota bacterium]